MSLKHLFNSNNLDLLFRIYTRDNGVGDALVSIQKKIFANWEFFALDTNGFYGGLVTCYNSQIYLIKSYGTFLGLCTIFQNLEMEKSWQLLNAYGPSKGHVDLCISILEKSCIEKKIMITGVDINLTPNIGEICDPSTQVDQLVGFFLDKFEYLDLVDIEPFEDKPTWVNNCSRSSSVEKRLKYFLMHHFPLDSL